MIRKAIISRYATLSYLYTLFYEVLSLLSLHTMLSLPPPSFSLSFLSSPRLLPLLPFLSPSSFPSLPKSSQDGSPILRPIWYEFPHEEDSFAVQESFLLGPSLLVTPVTSEGQVLPFLSLLFSFSCFLSVAGRALSPSLLLSSPPAPLPSPFFSPPSLHPHLIITDNYERVLPRWTFTVVV